MGAPAEATTMTRTRRSSVTIRARNCTTRMNLLAPSREPQSISPIDRKIWRHSLRFSNYRKSCRRYRILIRTVVCWVALINTIGHHAQQPRRQHPRPMPPHMRRHGGAAGAAAHDVFVLHEDAPPPLLECRSESCAGPIVKINPSR